MIRWGKIAAEGTWAALGGTERGEQLGALATINLSQISEFALVICMLGTGYGHIETDTLTIIIWTFAFLAVLATYLIDGNAKIYRLISYRIRKLRGLNPGSLNNVKQDEVSFSFEVINLDWAALEARAALRNEFEAKVGALVTNAITKEGDQSEELALAKVRVEGNLKDGTNSEVNVTIFVANTISKGVADSIGAHVFSSLPSQLVAIPGMRDAELGDLSIAEVSEAVVTAGHGEDDHGHEDIVLLGFHRIAFMLVAEFQAKSPEMLKHLHVIDTNQGIMPVLRKKGVKCSYGDICAPDVLEHCHHGEPSLVISTIPDSLLHGVTNAMLLKIAQKVWPNAHYIVTADNPQQASQLYTQGADYVLRSAKLCAERLQDLLTKHRSSVTSNESELAQLFNSYRAKDKDKRSSFIQQRLH